jgi:hypothetical protein
MRPNCGSVIGHMALDPDRREQLLHDVIRRIEGTKMVAPAILFLEAYKPLAFLGAQLLWFANPFLSFGFKQADVSDITRLVEDPAGVEELIVRLEASQKGNP